MSKCVRVLVLVLSVCCSGLCMAREHEHTHHGGADPSVKPPRVLLDKSPRIVWYQLDRLDNQRLLLVERNSDDPKYEPVFKAILIRAGMARQVREEALAGLVALNNSDPSIELLEVLEDLDTNNRDQKRVGHELAAIMLDQPATTLAANRELFSKAIESQAGFFRVVGFAGLIAGGTIEHTSEAEADKLDWLAAMALVPDDRVRGEQLDAVISLLSASQPKAVREAAIAALAFMPEKDADMFRLIAPFLSDEDFRTTAVRTLLSIPPDAQPSDLSGSLVETLVGQAEATPADARTMDAFVDAMQLTDQLLAKLPVDDARVYRQRLREITVRVIRIQTVQEEMRYDTSYFAVEAGRPVQVVLRNEDLMPHNFVITVPGALQDVAMAGAELGLMPGFEGKPYIPVSEKVLFGSDMVQANQQVRLTFTAPKEPGEYPYVCTFPRHWMRMYGVMIVVEDLDDWLQNPTEPVDPIGSTRSFVQSWTIDDFANEIQSGLRGRSPEIGRRMFEEATCAQCHKVNGQGGAVGPELADAFQRWKGDPVAVLREILDPSHRIDPKYAVQLVITDDGQVFTGIIQAEDKSSVSLITNPEVPTPTIVERDNIEEIVKSSVSMMPKALLDRFSRAEVLELLAYLQALKPNVEVNAQDAGQ